MAKRATPTAATTNVAMALRMMIPTGACWCLARYIGTEPTVHEAGESVGIDRVAPLALGDPAFGKAGDPSLPVEGQQRVQLHWDHHDHEDDAHEWDIEERLWLRGEVPDPLDRAARQQPGGGDPRHDPRVVDDRPKEEVDRDRQRERS